MSSITPYITLDFGSSNSGALINHEGKNYNPNDLIYVHQSDSDNTQTKTPSEFWLKRSLLNQSDITEDDIKIYSPIFYEETGLQSANFIWGLQSIKKALKERSLHENNDWVRIKHPKMALYRENTDPYQATCMGHDKSMHPLSKILHIFFLVIKKECAERARQAGLIFLSDSIKWGITVPGMAIWNQRAVDLIKTVANTVFGNQVTILSEPECALIGANLAGRGSLDFVEGRYSLVMDLGGGTTDISVVRETRNSTDNSEQFDEIKSTKADSDPTTSVHAGGNEIDDNFKSFLCSYIADSSNIPEPIELYLQFRKEDPIGSMEFDEAWTLLKKSDDISFEEIIYFSPGRRFLDWLKERYPQEASKKISDYGYFQLDGDKLRNKVFQPVYKKILSAIEMNLTTLKAKGINVGVCYFAGGLSLDRNLKRQINNLIDRYFPKAQKIEAGNNAVIGAVQRGGCHLLVNEQLMRRMARKTFYTTFCTKYTGDLNDLRTEFGQRLRRYYHGNLRCPFMDDKEINRILDEQWKYLNVDYNDNTVEFLCPVCVKHTPVTETISFGLSPMEMGQTSVGFTIYSSDKSYQLFPNEDVIEEGYFFYDFGEPWECAGLEFDPISNAVSGTAIFKLTDKNGRKVKDMVINNVSKKGY